MEEAINCLDSGELEFQAEHIKKMIKSYAHYATRDKIIFAPLHSKNNVCRYKDLVFWEGALKRRITREISSTPL
ncbi:conserved hypothetical protein [Lausannevirus]|uniref:Uncharacterized protein n=1 Tax=Lausannevirus TaxID=999883 RepID=F2WLJ0_9VIRU|nr:hypothetical protein LAU_0262 [Lausannevirus]AEA07113.1 conserved hypothetical protein [Lausannevirus]